MEGSPLSNHNPITALPNRDAMFFPNDLWLTPLFFLNPKFWVPWRSWWGQEQLGGGGKGPGPGLACNISQL